MKHWPIQSPAIEAGLFYGFQLKISLQVVMGLWRRIESRWKVKGRTMRLTHARMSWAAAVVLSLSWIGCAPKKYVQLGQGMGVPADTLKQLERQEGLSREEAMEVLRFQMQSLEEAEKRPTSVPQPLAE
jgi:hypothetical protein